MLKLQRQRAWKFICGHRVLSIAAGHVIVMTALAAIALNFAFGSPLFRASAEANCATGDTRYSVVAGDTLGSIAQRNQTTVQELAQHNNITNINMIYTGQTICLPGGTSEPQGDKQAMVPQVETHQADAVKGAGNVFPYGQCTWWANERYHQLHGVYVPWTTNSNAEQWTARATDFHWQVSSKPTAGAIINLQERTQGAGDLGHVAIVEKVLPDEQVLASNMNWAGHSDIVDVHFAAGPGVTFIQI